MMQIELQSTEQRSRVALDAALDEEQWKRESELNSDTQKALSALVIGAAKSGAAGALADLPAHLMALPSVTALPPVAVSASASAEADAMEGASESLPPVTPQKKYAAGPSVNLVEAALSSALSTPPPALGPVTVPNSGSGAATAAATAAEVVGSSSNGAGVGGKDEAMQRQLEAVRQQYVRESEELKKRVTTDRQRQQAQLQERLAARRRARAAAAAKEVGKGCVCAVLGRVGSVLTPCCMIHTHTQKAALLAAATDDAARREAELEAARREAEAEAAAREQEEREQQELEAALEAQVPVCRLVLLRCMSKLN